MLLAAVAPLVVLIHSVRGEIRVPVRLDPQAGPVLPAPLLLPALGARATLGDGWADVTLDRAVFRFYLGAPVVAHGGALYPLAGSATMRRDTLQLPIQFLAEVLPRALAARFRWDPALARLADGLPAATATRPTTATVAATADPNRLSNGLRKGHVVTLDPGHGGRDPGNPGLYFPRGIREKDVTLDIGILLREELRRRGIGVIMTRARDTLIDLRRRGAYCQADCDLFVSLHVNSLPRRTGFNRVRGFETYYLAEAKTEDAARVARMENEAIRFEAEPEAAGPASGLDFILKDLQLNEHQRESARAAELIQSYLQEAHTGPDRGVKQAGFMVLTTAQRPAILIEVGYSTNPEDAKLLTRNASQRNLAVAIADAIVAYLLEYERKLGLGVSSAGSGRADRP